MKLDFGKNLGGQKLQQSFPEDVVKKVVTEKRSSPSPQSTGERQPWEMTKKEWQAEHAFEDINPYTHKYAVEKALSEGKPVPESVLKDYPELQKKETPTLRQQYDELLAKRLKGSGFENDMLSPVYRNAGQDAFNELKKITGRKDITFFDLDRPQSPKSSLPPSTEEGGRGETPTPTKMQEAAKAGEKVGIEPAEQKDQLLTDLKTAKEIFDNEGNEELAIAKMKKAGLTISEAGQVVTEIPGDGVFKTSLKHLDKFIEKVESEFPVRPLKEGAVPRQSKKESKYTNEIGASVEGVKSIRAKIADIESVKEPVIEKPDVEGADWYRVDSQGKKVFYRTEPKAQKEIPNRYKQANVGQGYVAQYFQDGQWHDTTDYFYPESSGRRYGSTKSTPYTGLMEENVPTSDKGLSYAKTEYDKTKSQLAPLREQLERNIKDVEASGYQFKGINAPEANAISPAYLPEGELTPSSESGTLGEMTPLKGSGKKPTEIKTPQPEGREESFSQKNQRLISEMNSDAQKNKYILNEFTKLQPELVKLRDEFNKKLNNIKGNYSPEKIQTAKSLADAIAKGQKFEKEYSVDYPSKGKEKISFDVYDGVGGSGYFPSDLLPHDMIERVKALITSDTAKQFRVDAETARKEHYATLREKTEPYQLTKDEAVTPIGYQYMQDVTGWYDWKDRIENNKAEWLVRDYSSGDNKDIIKQFKSGNEARKYAREHDVEVLPLGEERTYYRVGTPPESGRSYNSMDNKYEDGVSVYVTPQSGSWAGGGGKATHYGKGRQINTGGDDEPIIITTNKWKNYPGHKAVIEEALRAGETVSPEVIADYPDLAKKYGFEPSRAPESGAQSVPASKSSKEISPESIQPAYLLNSGKVVPAGSNVHTLPPGLKAEDIKDVGFVKNGKFLTKEEVLKDKGMLMGLGLAASVPIIDAAPIDDEKKRLLK